MTARDELVTAIMHHPWLDSSAGQWFEGYCPECQQMIAGGYNSPSHASHIADAILAAGYKKPRVITTVDEVVTFMQGTKFYSLKTTHSWELNDLTNFRGALVQGTGGGYTYLRDFIEHEAPLTVLHEPQP